MATTYLALPSRTAAHRHRTAALAPEQVPVGEGVSGCRPGSAGLELEAPISTLSPEHSLGLGSLLGVWGLRVASTCCRPNPASSCKIRDGPCHPPPGTLTSTTRRTGPTLRHRSPLPAMVCPATRGSSGLAAHLSWVPGPVALTSAELVLVRMEEGRVRSRCCRDLPRPRSSLHPQPACPAQPQRPRGRPLLTHPL